MVFVSKGIELPVGKLWHRLVINYCLYCKTNNHLT